MREVAEQNPETRYHNAEITQINQNVEKSTF